MSCVFLTHGVYYRVMLACIFGLRSSYARVVIHHSTLFYATHKYQRSRWFEFFRFVYLKTLLYFAGTVLNESPTRLLTATMTTSENGFTDKE